MSIHIIIDGYNLIRSSSLFSEHAGCTLEMERDSLIGFLAAYKKMKAHKITIVFDGTGSSIHGISRQRDRMKGIHIVYSRPGELADSVIKKMVESEGNRCVVVTSDREVADHAISNRASVISSPEFEEKLILAGYLDMKGAEDDADYDGWNPTTRKKGPSKRLPKSKRQIRLKIKKL